MLALTRKIGERVFVGDDVIVTVIAINGNRVRLGFSAPPEVPIHREELRTSIKTQGRKDHARQTKSKHNTKSTV